MALKPVKSSYRPGYPDRLTEQEIRDILRPSLLKRFSAHTLLVSSMAVGASLYGGGLAAADGPPPPPANPNGYPDVPKTTLPDLPNAGHDTDHDAKLRDQIKQLVDEVLGPYAKNNYWNPHSSIVRADLVPGNPPLKYPRIPICYGNSYVGVFDTEVAKAATFRLFEQYGIKLEKNVRVKGDGYEFVADGYNEKYHIGFEMIMPQGEVGFTGPKKFPVEPAEDCIDLKDPAELKALGRDVSDGKLRLFVIEGAKFSNMDGDLYTPTQYYMGSVIDYLNWLHGDKQIAPQKLFGRVPQGGAMRASWGAWLRDLPGCNFEQDTDLKAWKVSKGTIAISDEWSSRGEHSLKVTLEPGGELIYTLPPGAPLKLRQQGDPFLYLSGQAADAGHPVTLTVELSAGEPNAWSESIQVTSTGPFSEFAPARAAAPLKNVKSIPTQIRITVPAVPIPAAGGGTGATGEKPASPATFYLDDLAFYSEEAPSPPSPPPPDPVKPHGLLPKTP